MSAEPVSSDGCGHCRYAHGQLTSDIPCPWCRRLVPAEFARRQWWPPGTVTEPAPLVSETPEFDYIERPNG